MAFQTILQMGSREASHRFFKISAFFTLIKRQNNIIITTKCFLAMTFAMLEPPSVTYLRYITQVRYPKCIIAFLFTDFGTVFHATCFTLKMSLYDHY